jgi:hypothetical protein
VLLLVALVGGGKHKDTDWPFGRTLVALKQEVQQMNDDTEAELRTLLKYATSSKVICNDEYTTCSKVIYDDEYTTFSKVIHNEEYTTFSKVVLNDEYTTFPKIVIMTTFNISALLYCTDTASLPFNLHSAMESWRGPRYPVLSTEYATPLMCFTQLYKQYSKIDSRT